MCYSWGGCVHSNVYHIVSGITFRLLKSLKLFFNNCDIIHTNCDIIQVMCDIIHVMFDNSGVLVIQLWCVIFSGCVI